MKLEELQNQIDALQKELDKLKENKPVKIDISNWEEKGVVSKSANIIVAPEDYWEEGNDGGFGVVDGKKRYFTWDEAIDKLSNDKSAMTVIKIKEKKVEK